MKYVFGPVTSSRLGRSLGLDLLGARICSMDCLYCEVGKTDTLTLERAQYVDAEAILAELRQWRAHSDLDLDHVTLGGMGEPCLNSDMPVILRGARGICPQTPLAVLTNSTLLPDPQVRAELLLADVVLPSLDSLVEKEYRAINRPVSRPDRTDLTAAAIAQGLLRLRGEFSGRIYLEILLAAGVNDSEENLALLRDYITQLAPDRVDVVTLSRPGTAPGTKGVSAVTLSRWREALGKTDKFSSSARLRHKDVTGSKPSPHRSPQGEELRQAVLASLTRRPQTGPQLAAALGADRGKIKNVLETLIEQGHILVMPSSSAESARLDNRPGSNTKDCDTENDTMDGNTFYGPAR